MTATLLEQAKPDQLVELVLPHLWASLVDGRAPANVCVDACITLRNAYVQLGVRAELLPVDLPIQNRDGSETRYGSLTPSWTGTQWNGRCVLVLPDSERIVDATIEQFDEVRAIGAGPMIGRTALSTHAPQDGGLMEPGAGLRRIGHGVHPQRPGAPGCAGSPALLRSRLHHHLSLWR